MTQRWQGERVTVRMRGTLSIPGTEVCPVDEAMLELYGWRRSPAWLVLGTLRARCLPSSPDIRGCKA